MPPRSATFARWVIPCVGVLGVPLVLQADEAKFFRGVNLNGPALAIDGNAWDGDDAADLSRTGNVFENQSVPLRPVTNPARATMTRSSRWGDKVDVTLTGVPDGAWQVRLYVWEDNQSERFDILVNDQIVLKGFNSGSAGSWKRLGPWAASSIEGKIKVSTRGGAANVSGLEVWTGAGEIPAPAAAFASVPTPEQAGFFERRIRPVLAERCYECHSATSKMLGGNLLLDSRAGIIRGGDSGPVMTPGDPEASLLIHAVRHTEKELAMPKDRAPLSPEEIADLETWVRNGAPDPRNEDTVAVVKARTSIDWGKAREWWSFRPLVLPEPPTVAEPSWPTSDLDRFILARLEQAGLKPAPPASKRTLIRRATFDLIGLPPTPEEIDAFLSDQSADAFAKVVDRLLASPHYGERWGRYWLDVVRYADTAGDNSDFPIPQMFRYRDWVISAFNRDLPYDQFVRQQLAGDLLPAEKPEEAHQHTIATGYIANARRFGSRVDDYPQHLTIEDTIDNLGRTFLGLTINCARCHDHKFDPITTQDYYALYGIFHSTRYPWPGIELDQKQHDLIPLAPAREVALATGERRERQQQLDAEVGRLKKELEAAEGDARKPLEKALEDARKASKNHQAAPVPYELAYAVAESQNIGDAAVQQKGDPAKPGAIVHRRFLTIFNGTEVPPDDKSSGRLRLAEWILAENNPLPPRVMANRIWLYHFGKGLVATPNDFGRQGKPPTHPELLDWLAQSFRKSGGSVKSMHRLIMLSRTWQSAGQRSDEAIARDPGNELLGSFPRRRLEAEAIRDTLLFLGAQLDTTRSGPHPFPPENEWKFTQHNPFKAVYETKRRSVYLMTQRIQRHPFLAIFDGADPSASTPLRPTSTTPLQALFLLNDPLIHEQSAQFANRLMAENKDDRARLDRAWQRALGRPPGPAELDEALRFLAAVRENLRSCTTADTAVTADDTTEAESWQAIVRVLFRLNEFVYID